MLEKKSGSDGLHIREVDSNEIGGFKKPQKGILSRLFGGDTNKYPQNTEDSYWNTRKAVFNDHSHRLIDGKYYNDLYSDEIGRRLGVPDKHINEIRSFYERLDGYGGYPSLVSGEELTRDFIHHKIQMLKEANKHKKNKAIERDIRDLSRISPKKHYEVNLA